MFQSNGEFLLDSGFSGLGVLSVASVFLVGSVGVSLHSLLGESGVLADTFESLSVKVFDGFNLGGLEGLDPFGEVELVFFGVAFLHFVHVVVDMNTEDSVSVHFGVVGFVLVGILGESGETLGVVGDVQTSVNGTFQSTENTVTGGGGDQTDVQHSLEGLLTVHVVVVHGVVFTVNFLLAFILLVQLVFLEESAGAEETSGVAGGVVGQTSVDAVLLELIGLSLSHNLVTFEGSIDDLADNLAAGDTGNKSVLGSVVFVLVLHGETLTGIVISLAFSTSAELGLETLEVGVVLVEFNESHKIFM